MKLKSREQELESIIRYKQNTVCKPMFYTPNLSIHISRVVWIAEEVCMQLGLDAEITHNIIRRAMFHDDAEIIAGDIATPVKQNWSQKEKDKYEMLCQNAIPILVATYGKDIGDDYEEILKEMEDYKSDGKDKNYNLIHAVIEYCDKFDALMEVTHELYGGSNSFLNSMKNTFTFDIDCYNYILERVETRRKKIEELLEISIPHRGILNLKDARKINTQDIVKYSEPHTPKSIQAKTFHESYDIWKNLHFTKGDTVQQGCLFIPNIT